MTQLNLEQKIGSKKIIILVELTALVFKLDLKLQC